MRRRTDTLGWGLVGAGWIADRFAADLSRVAGARRSMVMARNQATAEDFRQRHGFTQACHDIAGVLDDPAVDIVYIATPNHTHEDFALAAIDAGKAVLVEKPLAVSSRAAGRMAEAARNKGVFLMEAMWTRFLPAVVDAFQRVEAGAIGRVRSIDAELAFRKRYDPHDRFFDPGAGGGALRDLGVYPLSLSLSLLGYPDTIGGAWRAAPTGVDRSADMHLRWSAAEAQLSCGFDREGANAFIVRGETGALRLDRHFLQAASFTAFAGRGPMLRTGRIARILDRLPRPGRSTVFLLIEGNGLTHQIRAVQAAVLAGETQCSAMPVSRSVAALELIEQLLASAPAQSD